MTHGLRSWIHALEQASPEFRARWPQHDAGREPAQYKELNQPIVGRLVPEQIPFQAEDAPELTFLLYTSKAGTDTEANRSGSTTYSPISALLPSSGLGSGTGRACLLVRWPTQDYSVACRATIPCNALSSLSPLQPKTDSHGRSLARAAGYRDRSREREM